MDISDYSFGNRRDTYTIKAIYFYLEEVVVRKFISRQ